jgi:hypothetical protein
VKDIELRFKEKPVAEYYSDETNVMRTQKILQYRKRLRDISAGATAWTDWMDVPLAGINDD